MKLDVSGFMLGNLSVAQIEDRLGIKLSEDEKEFFRSTHQNIAENVAVGKWHCFDLPLIIICGDMDMGKKVRDVLLPYAGQMKEQIQIGWR